MSDNIIFLGMEFANDIALLPKYFAVWGIGLMILFLAILFHEYGHSLAFKKIGKGILIHKVGWKFLAGTKEDYENLTDKQYLNITATGVAFGLIPIILSSFFWGFYFLMIFPYFWGCRRDLMQLLENTNFEE